MKLKIGKIKDPAKVAATTLHTCATLIRAVAVFAGPAVRIALAALALGIDRLADAVAEESDGGRAITWPEIEAIAQDIRGMIEHEISGGSDDGA